MIMMVKDMPMDDYWPKINRETGTFTCKDFSFIDAIANGRIRMKSTLSQ